ncbi:hypothetical protein VIN01S_22270 [Vibrio inusitatus NBRC 102082]|uniref:Zorya protein ZorC EH domain-containing protein n=1 Tax=Vibrio inusitatus NBRC 102082 TaxID=1219070 RepID=A0A4Y3HW66_9VIBR|nr:hypothetical protein [Vibrio inusitatus]GEA51423.1 hypothetical protein VIN01S_22270 [Vibrio inusitatus NBRC 102082]
MNRNPWFLEPALPSTPKVNSLTPPLGGESHQLQSASNSFTQKKLIQLIAKLERFEPLSSLEWLIILRSEEEYQGLETSEKERAIKAVWTAIESDEVRFSELVKKLVSGIARNYIAVASWLLDSFPRVLPKSFSRLAKQQIEIARYLVSEQYLLCARATMSNGKSLDLFFKGLGLEHKGSHIVTIALQAEDAIPLNPSEAQLTWWRSCQDFISEDNTIEQLERLLDKVRTISSDSAFGKWIKHRCLPDSKTTIWYRLSKASQLKLKSFFNVTEYKSVSKIFELLIETSDDSSLNERQVKNLRSRIMFWANYSDAFKRVRFFLTDRSSSILRDKVNLDELRVQTMNSSPLNNQSEICVFDVGNYFLVERFIGPHFDLGIFERTDELEQALFESEYVDAETISRLEPDWVHDHLSYYQNRIARFLNGKGIKPGKRAPAHWLKPLAPEQQRKVDDDRDKRYRNILDKATYFKTGRRF